MPASFTPCQLTSCKAYDKLYIMSSNLSETQIRILEATLRLMEKKRGRGVRIEDIAAAAGVSRQAVYLNFGSRSGLLIATSRYLDVKLGLEERVQPLYDAPNPIAALDGSVVFWANYIPDIYGLAKALLAARETDKAAAAAWKDSMDELYERMCLFKVQWLEREGLLAPEWTVKEAADFFWATLSISTWEALTIERGWTQEQYIARIQQVLKSTLVKAEVAAAR